MTHEEFKEIARMIHGTFRFVLTDDEQFLVWESYLKDFPLEEVKSGVGNYIMSETKEPTVAGIIQYIRKAQEMEHRAKQWQNQRTVHCIHCKDTGLIVTESPTGIMQGRPCRECSRGRENYPWEFFTKEEQIELAKRRGYPKPHEAGDTFRQNYLTGDKK